jgi:hypothetical protein
VHTKIKTVFTENYIVHQGFLHFTELGPDNCLLFVSDEDVFHTNGYITRHNLCVCVCVVFWSTKNTVIVKVNVFCAVLHNIVIGSFFFFLQKIPSPISAILICWNCMQSQKLRKESMSHIPTRWSTSFLAQKLSNSQHFSA